MGRRSIAYNGADARCRIVDGDLRDVVVAAPFDLVTGTPPYFPRGTGNESAKTHAAAARFEHRGGVADYLAIASQCIAPEGRIVICSASLERDRVTAAVCALGLGHRAQWTIVPRVGKLALVTVDGLEGTATAAPERHELIVRDRAGQWTTEFQRVRADLGMPIARPGA
jgi:tRNA1(Val) A37 N6-methylase TrmN6